MKKIILLIAIAIFSHSLYSQTGNILQGYLAGNSTSGGSNIFLGNWAGYSNTSTSYNVFIGYESGYASTGDKNVFIGNATGNRNTSGYGNLFLGNNAGFWNTTGYGNLFSGHEAGYYNSTGYANDFYGYMAGQNNDQGDFNSFFGHLAGNSTVNGYSNTCMGAFSGLSYGEGDYNTFIGYNADANASNYSNSTALGNVTTVTASNQIRIGNSSITSIGGQVGWTTISDVRVKKNIQSNVPGLDFILKLKPVTYNIDVTTLDKLLRPDSFKLKLTQEEVDAKTAKSKIVYTGFIAQEVEKTAKEIGYDFSGVDAPKNDKDIYGLRYAEFTVPLVKAVQELADKNTLLKNINDSLISIIININSRLSAVENNVNKGNGTSNSFSSPANSNQAYLEQNSPNPFSDNTVVKYFIPENSVTSKISVISDKGLEVMNFNIEQKGAGNLTISGNTLNTGNYTLQLFVDGKLIDIKKMLLIK